jgi:hypothetical protein
MGRLLGGIGAIFAYFCIGSVLAAALGFGYLWSNGDLSSDKMLAMIAAAQGINLAEQNKSQIEKDAERDSAQPSIEDVARARAMKLRDVELREQALRQHIENVKFEQTKLNDENSRYNRIREAFEAELKSLRTGAIATNEENVRLILENIKPKQAKDQILRMISNGEMRDVVMILSAMPITKRSKIIGEFKTDQEAVKLAELLNLIREGVPEVDLIDDTKKQLDAPSAAQQ